MRARQETTCEGSPEHPHQLLTKPDAVGGAPKLSGPRRDNPTPAFHSASRAEDLPHCFCSGRTAIATHLSSSRNHFLSGERKGRLREERVRDSGKRSERGLVLGVAAANSHRSGRHAEVRLHLEDEAAAEPRGSASTSQGSPLTLHCEEAAAEKEEEEEAAPGPAPAQSPAAAEWPPASLQDPPPHLRKAAHWARRAQLGQLGRPHAAIRSRHGGRGADPSVSTAARPARGGGRGTGDGRAPGGCARLRA